MKVNVLLSPNNVDELYFTSKTTVVIDVLRATSVIVQALNNGAKEVIPVGSIDFAMKISVNAHGGQTLLCGERNTKMIDGFDLGNSPQDYTKGLVHRKSIILFTTNGSKAIVKAKYSNKLLVASFNNLSAIAESLIDLGSDVEIVAAGSNGMFCIEDTICSGALIQTMKSLKEDIEITDAGWASLVLNDQFGSDVGKMLRESEHGKILIGNGFEEDLAFCSERDNMPIVPFYKGGEIKLFKKD
ncbi:MAG: 2-phosphosulfolactate phosphatase [Melioribacteraceae bacterium]|nr:2-phosphosulfolactate phosphatase [Melioribacteraceae bacterium]